MFNNRIYKFARKVSKNYLFNELRKDYGFDPYVWLDSYDRYLSSEHKLDEDEKDYAMTFAAELASRPRNIYYLDEIYYDMRGLDIDINFLRLIAQNTEEAVYQYTINHFGYIIDLQGNFEFNTSNFLSGSDYDKRTFVANNGDYIVLNNNFKGIQISIIFKLLNRYMNILYGGDIERALDLIEFYNESKDYILPLVYNKQKTQRKFLYFRQRDIESPKLIKIISDYIMEDRENRKDIIKSMDSLDNFYNLLNEKYPDLKEYISSSNINLDDYGILYVFSKMKQSFKEPEESKEQDKNESKYFKEFSLPNSSNEERKIFDKLEKLGLYAIPAKQAGLINLVDDEGQKFGFRIDFLLPCNVREYDGENYTLRSDIVFVGEYFGYYGPDYERKKIRKIQWQNNLESALDQRCLHIELGSNLCNVLKEKNIDSKCYPDFGGELFSVRNDNQKKTYYVKSQIQHFLYQYLVNELLWEINYDYSLNTLDNFNRVKENNGVYLDRFEKLLLNVEKYNPGYLVKECADIVESYKNNFTKKRKKNIRNLRLSFVYNHKNTSKK
jgi:hypothetical protein